MRDLAEQRLDGERRRFEVGMSTSFLVIRTHRDLAQVQTSELSAILQDTLALVDFEALQQAGPVGRRRDVERAGTSPLPATPTRLAGAAGIPGGA